MTQVQQQAPRLSRLKGRKLRGLVPECLKCVWSVSREQ